MRPTIPLSDWRIAVDLVASKKIRRQTGHPAEGCTCDQCRSWRKAADTAFPRTIAEELERLGVEKARPMDLYVSREANGVVEFRVMYHIAGKIISGPSPWFEHSEFGKMHNYHFVQSEPTSIGLRVSTTKDSFEYAPDRPSGTTSDILCLDFRLQVRDAAA